MSEFTISGVRVHNPPIEGTGQTLLATLVIESGAFVVVGASLCLTDAGEHRVWLPKLNDNKRIALRSGADRQSLVQAARAAYHALAGVPAEKPLATAIQKAGTQDDPT